MSYKFVKPAFKDDLYMLKVVIEGKEVWATCSKAVKGYAKATLQEGDGIEFEYEETDGKITITGNITKVGSTSTTQAESELTEIPSVEPTEELTETPPEPVKTPPPSRSPAGKPKTVQESIERQNVNNAVSRTLIALQGQVSEQNVEVLIDKLFEIYHSKLRG